MSETPAIYENHPFVSLDAQNPKCPSSLFAYMGDTAIAQPVYSGRDVATLEELYQAFKARLLNELLQEGWLFQPTELSRQLAAFDEESSEDEADSAEAWAERKANETRKRGRPKLSDEERAARTAQRKANLPTVSVEDEPLSHPDLIDRRADVQNDVAITANRAENALDDDSPRFCPF